MKPIITVAAALAALAQPALAQPALAQAQNANCVAQDDMTAATIYAMPLIVETLQHSCRQELSATGFLARKGASFAQPYRSLQLRNWPATARVLAAYSASPEMKKLTGQNDLGELSSFLRNQPPELLRPIVDASIKTLAGSKIRKDDCSKIERGMELIAPLPPENAGGIVTFILDVTETDGPKICPVPPK